MTPARPRVGISRCLVGDAVRYDGGHRRAEAIITALGASVDWVPVCPEVEAGMGVPREPVRLVRTEEPDGRLRLLGVTSGTDWTAPMEAWAEERMRSLADLSGFVLKARSPSCGLTDAPVADGVAARATAAGRGLFARALTARIPDLPVADEETLQSPSACESFLARVLAHHRRRLAGR